MSVRDPSDGTRNRTGRPSNSELVRQVADMAGTKEGEVRAFFSRPQRMSADKRRRIAEAALKLKYRPRRPRRGSLSGVRVGFEIPRVWSSDQRINPIYAMQLHALVSAVERLDGELSPFTVDPSIANYDKGVGTNRREAQNGDVVAHQAWLREYATATAPEKYREVARLRRLRAFFISDPRVRDARIEALVADHVPFVLIGRPTEPGAYFCADIKDEDGFRQMCQKLKDAGCTRIGHFGFSDDMTQTPTRRRQAVRAELGDRPTPIHVKHYEDHSDEAFAKLVSWLQANPRMQAVVCDSDDYAALLAQAAHLAGRRIALRLVEPQDLLLAGCDDAPVRIAAPIRWMTLSQPAVKWADAATALLVESLNGGQPRTDLVSPQFIDASDVKELRTAHSIGRSAL
jgi:LacI family transcriptional regulator